MNVLKENLHPEYEETTITCACGNAVNTRSTKKDVKVEICAKCHPFFTGKQGATKKAGRVEKFNKKYGFDKETK